MEANFSSTSKTKAASLPSVLAFTPLRFRLHLNICILTESSIATSNPKTFSSAKTDTSS